MTGWCRAYLESPNIATSIVNNCYFSGDVYGETNIGGVVGRVGGDSAINTANHGRGEVINSYAIGTVNGNTSAGGIAGLLWLGSINNCVAWLSSINRVEGTATSFGRIMGTIGGTRVNNWALSTMIVISSQPTTGLTGNGQNGLNALATGQLDTESWWKTADPGGPGWTFDDPDNGAPWVWCTTDNRPRLWWE